jgi:Ca2+/Na+ antiporter
MNTEKDKILFWFEDPNILLNQKYIFEFFPTENMSYYQQLNAITRSIIILTVIILIINPSYRVFLISVITLLMVYLMYYFKNKQSIKEGLEELELNDERGNPEPYNEEEIDSMNKGTALNNEEIEIKNSTYPTNELEGATNITNVFDEPDSQNPFSNVMINHYNNSADKKAAPPSYNKNTQSKLLESAKKLVQEVNNEQPDITDKLFSDLGEKLNLEQSMRPYYSNPSTTIPNDQTAFANFCYGNMISCKENNPFACAKNVSRYTNY